MEVPNQTIIARYKELLANRSHDVIVMNLAIDLLEEEVKQLTEDRQKISEENETLKRSLGRANEMIKSLQDKDVPPIEVIPGEIVE